MTDYFKDKAAQEAAAKAAQEKLRTERRRIEAQHNIKWKEVQKRIKAVFDKTLKDEAFAKLFWMKWEEHGPQPTITIVLSHPPINKQLQQSSVRMNIMHASGEVFFLINENGKNDYRSNTEKLTDEQIEAQFIRLSEAYDRRRQQPLI